MKTTSEKIKIGASIICKDHPEWGTWRVTEDSRGWFEIHGSAGSKALDKAEVDKFWMIDPTQGRTIWNSDGTDGPVLICPPPKKAMG